MPTILYEDDDQVEAPESGVETSEAPETPAAPDPDESTPPSAPSETAPADGQPRDAHGRFAQKEAGSEEQAPAGDEPAPPEATSAQPSATEPETPPEPPAPAPAEPWSVRVHGRHVQIGGAMFDPANRRLVVEGDGLARLQQLAARGVEYEAVGRRQMQDMSREVADLKAQLEEKSATEQALEKLAELDGDDLYEAIQRFKQELPVLQERQRAAQLERQLQALQRGQGQPTGQPADPREAQAQQMREIVEGAKANAEHHFDGFIKQFPGLPRDAVEEIKAVVLRNPGQYLRRATDDDALTYGVQVGQPVFDSDLQYQDVERLAKLALRGVEVAKKTQAAAAHNAQVMGGQKTKAPPTVAPATSAPVAGSGEKEPQTWEEWKKWARV